MLYDIKNCTNGVFIGSDVGDIHFTYVLRPIFFLMCTLQNDLIFLKNWIKLNILLLLYLLNCTQNI